MARVDKSIHVQTPIETAYELWSDFEMFPRFMGHVKEVRRAGDAHYHWKTIIAGITREWDAVVTEMIRNDHITWRSIAGPTNEGTVSFSPEGDGTRVSFSVNV